MSEEEKKAGYKRFCEYNARRMDAYRKGVFNNFLEKTGIEKIDWN